MGKTKEQRIIEKLIPIASDGSEALIIPNYSGVQKAALKNLNVHETPLTTKNLVVSSISPPSDSTTAIQIKQTSGSAMVNFDTSNARVGIGTNSPSSKVHIVDSVSGSVNLFIQNLGGTTASTKIILANRNVLGDENVGAIIYALRTNASQAGDTDLIFNNSASTSMNENMRIKANKRVGIGTDSPSTQLHLSGGALTISNTTQPSTPAVAGALFVSGGALYYIGSSGTVTTVGVA